MLRRASRALWASFLFFFFFLNLVQYLPQLQVWVEETSWKRQNENSKCKGQWILSKSKPCWDPISICGAWNLDCSSRIASLLLIFSSPVSYCDQSLSGVCCASWIVCCASSTIALNNISDETIRPILIKLHINNPWMVDWLIDLFRYHRLATYMSKCQYMVLYQYCSNEVDPYRILVTMATKSKNLKKIFSTETNGQIWL